MGATDRLLLSSLLLAQLAGALGDGSSARRASFSVEESFSMYCNYTGRAASSACTLLQRRLHAWHTCRRLRALQP